ncbi:integrase catalytic domain-containing protein [Trichonephila clavipes]|nr:integrase catalytic domain-containing protein [Trichonephila clavipes]
MTRYIWTFPSKDAVDAYVMTTACATCQPDGSITRITIFTDNVSEHVDIVELEVKLKKIDQLQRKIEELKELLFGLENAKPTEEAEFEEDLYVCVETEFGWIAGGRLQGTKTNNLSCYLLKDNDSVDDTLMLFFEIESLSIKDDPCYRKDDQAMNIFKETVQYNSNRYVVELPFRKHWNELSNSFSVAKHRFQSLWRRLRRDKTLYTQYKETIQDYLNQGIIEKVKDTEINVHKPMHYLPHQAIKKEGRVTTSTGIVFDAASHQANELSLNDCLWPGPNLNPNLLDVLINFRLNRVAISSDIH